MNQRARRQTLLALIDSCLREGLSIEVDLGRFKLKNEAVTFERNNRPRVFLAYASEDVIKVRRLYRALKRAGFEPWMDKQNLLAGQNWPRAIEREMEISDFVLACFSKRAASKPGYFQCELQYALDLRRQQPLDQIYFIPVRLEHCELPHDIAKTVQYADLFPNWTGGVRRLISSMRRQSRARKNRHPHIK